jgi:spoIIIJ-associated protein
MISVEAKGKTIEDAIDIGLKELKTTRDKVNVEILEENKSSFFNIINNNSFKVRLTLKHDTIDFAGLLEDVIEKIKHTLKLMNFNIEVTGTVFGGRILLKLSGEDANFLIGKSGEVLDSFEDLINLMISKEQKHKIKIEIDIDNYRRDREDKIKAMLVNIIDNVLQTGQAYKMNQMTKRDRKTVHLFVEKHETLESISQGEGRDRYIVISKKNKISFE